MLKYVSTTAHMPWPANMQALNTANTILMRRISQHRTNRREFTTSSAIPVYLVRQYTAVRQLFCPSSFLVYARVTVHIFSLSLGTSARTNTMPQSPPSEADSSTASQETPHILWNPKLTTVSTTARHLSLSSAIRIRSTLSHSTLLRTPTSFTRSLPFRLRPKTPVRISLRPHTCHMPRPSQPGCLDSSNYVMKLPILQFPTRPLLQLLSAPTHQSAKYQRLQCQVLIPSFRYSSDFTYAAAAVANRYRDAMRAELSRPLVTLPALLLRIRQVCGLRSKRAADGRWSTAHNTYADTVVIQAVKEEGQACLTLHWRHYVPSKRRLRIYPTAQRNITSHNNRNLQGTSEILTVKNPSSAMQALNFKCQVAPVLRQCGCSLWWQYYCLCGLHRARRPTRIWAICDTAWQYSEKHLSHHHNPYTDCPGKQPRPPGWAAGDRPTSATATVTWLTL
jgi:hypothetical protein